MGVGIRWRGGGGSKVEGGGSGGGCKVEGGGRE